MKTWEGGAAGSESVLEKTGYLIKNGKGILDMLNTFVCSQRREAKKWQYKQLGLGVTRGKPEGCRKE